jgi:hypothetical protein
MESGTPPDSSFPPDAGRRPSGLKLDLTLRSCFR